MLVNLQHHIIVSLIIRLAALQLMVAAEACSSDPAGVPQELLACTVPSLVTLVCAAPAPHSAAAAAALAAALLGSASIAWRPHLGDLETFTGRCALQTSPLYIRAGSAPVFPHQIPQ